MDPIFASLTGGLRFKHKTNNSVQKVFNPSTKTIPAEVKVGERPEDAARLRKRLKLNLVPSPADDPTLAEPISSFDDLMALGRKVKKGKGKGGVDTASKVEVSEDVVKGVLANMKRMGWTSPTPVQMQAIPLMLSVRPLLPISSSRADGRAQGRDLIAQASTGSGKTLAFLLPLFLSMPLPRAGDSTRKPRALIIEPTRELTRQVCAVARVVAGDLGWRVAVLGEEEGGAGHVADGAPRKRKRGTGEAPGRVAELPSCDLLITTPLKLVYLLRAAASQPGPLGDLRHVVLDEADHLLSTEGALVQSHEILTSLPPASEVRKHLFSATLPSSIETLASTLLSPSLRVRLLTGGVHPSASSTPLLTQRLDFVNTESSKLPHLRSLVARGGLPPPVLLFVQSPTRATELASLLSAEGLRASAIHGGLTPVERDSIVSKFVLGSEIWFLVATDVFSRGIDLRGVRAVVNYDFPQSATSYVHRIGRAGRAGAPGLAVTLFTKADGDHLRTIVNVMRNSGCEVPGWMVDGLPKVGKKERKMLRVKPPERVGVKRAARGMDDVEPRKGGKKKRKPQPREGDEDEGDDGEDDDGWLPADAF